MKEGWVGEKEGGRETEGRKEGKIRHVCVLKEMGHILRRPVLGKVIRGYLSDTGITAGEDEKRANRNSCNQVVVGFAKLEEGFGSTKD